MMALGVGIGGTFGLLFSGAMLSALLEQVFARENLDAFGWLGVSVAASAYWWASFPVLWAPLVLMFVVFGVFAVSFLRERGAGEHDPALRGLAPELVLELAGHPKKMPKELKVRLNSALADYSDLHELLTEDARLASDEAIDAAGILGDAAATLREINTRVSSLRRLDRLAKERASDRVQDTLARARAQLDVLQSSLHDAAEAVIVYAAAAGAVDSAALREQTEKLRCVTEGLDEVNAMLGAGDE
jgi:hypothetical protein